MRIAWAFDLSLGSTYSGCNVKRSDQKLRVERGRAGRLEDFFGEFLDHRRVRAAERAQETPI
ncbi:MAG: hypothetical protein PVSMB1_19210 [Gemmatimonadaceae bacterium]